MKAAPIGTIWIARARLFNSAGQAIGTCTDTPNAIAKALIERQDATSIKESFSNVAINRREYRNRMHPGNQCPSGFAKI